MYCSGSSDILSPLWRSEFAQALLTTGYGPSTSKSELKLNYLVVKSESSVVPLNGSNYLTWKMQCRMALMKDGLWNIVNGTETTLTGDGERHVFFA